MAYKVALQTSTLPDEPPKLRLSRARPVRYDIAAEDLPGGAAHDHPDIEAAHVRVDQLEAQVRRLTQVAAPPSEPRVTYSFKVGPELVWAVLTALIPVMIAATSDLDKVMDWKVWALALVAALVRAGGGALVAAITGPQTTPSHTE